MECDHDKNDVSAGSVFKAGPEIGRGVILEKDNVEEVLDKDNVEEEYGCDVTQAVGGVFLEEKIETMVDGPKNKGQQIGEYGVKLRGNVMASAHTDSTVKIWDTRTWECLQVLEGPDKHGGNVHTVDFNDKFVVTGSGDGKIKLWDLKTGLFIRDLPVLKEEGQAHQVKKIRMKDAMIACDIIFRNGPREIQVFNFDTNLSHNLNKQNV